MRLIDKHNIFCVKKSPLLKKNKNTKNREIMMVIAYYRSEVNSLNPNGSDRHSNDSVVALLYFGIVKAGCYCVKFLLMFQWPKKPTILLRESSEYFGKKRFRN